MPLNRASRGRLPVLLFVAVAAFYFATAWVCGPASNWPGQTSEYYALLTDAFLAGQTSLLVPPPSELLALPNPYDPLRNGEFRLHDASLYHGKHRSDGPPNCWHCRTPTTLSAMGSSGCMMRLCTTASTTCISVRLPPSSCSYPTGF